MINFKNECIDEFFKSKDAIGKIYLRFIFQEVVNRLAEDGMAEQESKTQEPSSQSASAKKPYKSWFSWRKNGISKHSNFYGRFGHF